MNILSSIKRIYFNNKAFFMFCLVYISIFLFIGPWGNFPINDDWDNQLQLLAFKEGDYRIHSAIDAAFILQAWIGYIWSLVFGNSFRSLRILTILFSLASAFLMYLVIKKNLNKRDTTLVLLSFFLHPIMLTSSLTFMTEIYFLFFTLAGYFYLQKYLRKSSNRYLVLGLLFSGLSILIRQLGIVIFIAFLISLILEKKLNIKVIIALCVTLAASIFLWKIYPQAGTSEPFRYSFIETKLISKRLREMVFILPIVGFAISPFFFKIQKRKIYIFISVLAVVLAYLIFKYDVFPLGNVFYVECLYCKTRYTPTFSIFDNVVFKMFLSFIIGFSLINFLFEVFRKKIYSNLQNDIFTLFMILGFSSILFFPEDIYDRYTLPFLMFLTIYIVNNFSIKKLSYIALSVIFTMSAFLNWEFYKMQNIMYKQTLSISERTGLVENIYSIDTYIMYMDALRKENYVGTQATDQLGREFKCYVQNYFAEDKDNPIFTLSDRLEAVLDGKISNPTIYDRKKQEGIRKIKNNLDSLIYNRQYFSFLYDSVGRNAYVGAYCDSDVIVN